MAGALLLAAPVSAQVPGRFDSEILAFERADAAQPPPASPVVFVGSSTIRLWPGLGAAFPDYPVLNRGFGGSHMSDLLHYFDRVVAPYSPAALVVYEGDNDLNDGKSTSRVLDDYREFLNRVRRALPATRVIFLAVKPSPSRAALLAAQRTLNAGIAELAAGDPQTEFLDVFTPMLGDHAQPRATFFVSDLLHLNAAGYALWESLLRPVLAAVLPVTPGAGAATTPWLFDFGHSTALTRIGPEPDDPAFVWNDITETVGAVTSGRLLNLVNRAGRSVPAGLGMLRRFSGADPNGTIASGRYAGNAARDSLSGSTEPSDGVSPVSPALRLIRLDLELAHDFTFYASRFGVDAHPATTHTVIGASTAATMLDGANILTSVAQVVGMRPNANGDITISLSPADGNTHPQRLTHLGVLEVTPRPPELRLDPPTRDDQSLRLNWKGTGRLERAPQVTRPWTTLEPLTGPPHTEPLAAVSERYFRVHDCGD